MSGRRAHTVFVALLLAIAAIGAFPAAAQAEEPKTLPLLVVVVGFDGGDGAQAEPTPYDDEYDWADTVFGSGDSLASYYLDMSEGTFTFSPASETSAFGTAGNTNVADKADDGIVHITLNRAHGRWGLVNDVDSIAQEFGRVVIEAFQQASPFVDFASYDANGNGMISPDELALVVCIAGYDASPFDDPDRSDIPVIWPHAGKLANSGDDEEETIGGVRVDSYIALAEYLTMDAAKPEDAMQEPLGVLYHELGHYLGLPDLYALNRNAENEAWGGYRVGMLSLMDNGGWAQVEDGGAPSGYRYEPTALDAWSRYVLGWKKPVIATESGDYRVSSELSEAGYSQLLIPTPDPDQYYLLENRLPEGQDSGLAEEYSEGNSRGGIVIWHVDKGVYRQYGFDNEANDTDHAPAVMELFFEAHDDRFTTDWARGTPVSGEPFYDATSCEANLGNSSAEIELPLYDGKGGGTPSDRTASGITVRFPTEAAREMTVHVEFASTVAGRSFRDYPLDAEDDSLNVQGSPLGMVASCALSNETGADVGVVDEQSILAGLPSGNISYAQAYGVLPQDTNIICYNLTGAQLTELAEQSIDVADDRRRVQNALDALAKIEFIDRIPQASSAVPKADRALSFGGMTFDADWDGTPGARARNVTIEGVLIDAERTYSVAVMPSVAESYGLFESLSPDNSMLWGTPSDAMRSFIELGNWEQVAATT